MKELSEEKQWKVFELLEGNLSELETQNFMNEINQDPILKDYYNSLKQTYLQPTNVVYPHKNRLIKSINWTISYKSYFKYAVAAMIVGIIGYFQFFQDFDAQNIRPKQQLSSNNYPLNQNSNNAIIDKPVSTIKSAVNIELNKAQVSVHKLHIRPLKSFEVTKFNPSTKLIEENQFLSQLIDNQYLTSNEKKNIMLKWLLMNSSNAEITNNQSVTYPITTEVNVVQQDILSPSELESKELNEIWVKEAKQMLKQGKMPKLKLVKTKQERKWLPKFDLEIQTETTSMVQNIID